MKISPLTYLVFLSLSGWSPAQEKADKSDKATETIERAAIKVTPEGLEAAVRMIDARNIDDQMVKAMVQAFESLPMDEDLKETMIREFSAEKNLTELKKMMAEVYAGQLSVDDLNAITAFYSTPAGKRIAAAEGDITVESMKAVQAWGEKLGAKIARDFEKKKRKADEGSF